MSLTLQLQSVEQQLCSLKMLGFMISCHIWFLHTPPIRCTSNSTVVLFSVPEDHHVLLRCGASDSSDVVWTHRDRRVPVGRQGSYDTDEDPQRLVLLSDGSLRLLQLEASDSGEYRCNQQLVAELQVLTGQDFTVSAGRTLLLPCGDSSKPRRRWYHRRDGGRREVIFTLFRNGTMKPEREGGRLSFESEALRIDDLQLDDAGHYQCNGNLWRRVSVQTEAVETKKKEKKKRPENALLAVAVVGLGFMVLLMAAVSVLQIGMSCRRKRRCRGAASQEDDPQLQPCGTSSRQTGDPEYACLPADHDVYEGPSPPEETIHYASLGRQNWRDRPRRTPADQNQHVIYSSVIARPAAR